VGRRRGGRIAGDRGDREYEVVDDSELPLEDRRHLSRLTHWKAVLQDRISSISNAVIGSTVRKYYFDPELFERDAPRAP